MTTTTKYRLTYVQPGLAKLYEQCIAEGMNPKTYTQTTTFLSEEAAVKYVAAYSDPDGQYKILGVHPTHWKIEKIIKEIILVRSGDEK